MSLLQNPAEIKTAKQKVEIIPVPKTDLTVLVPGRLLGDDLVRI